MKDPIKTQYEKIQEELEILLHYLKQIVDSYKINYHDNIKLKKMYSATYKGIAVDYSAYILENYVFTLEDYKDKEDIDKFNNKIAYEYNLPRFLFNIEYTNNIDNGIDYLEKMVDTKEIPENMKCYGTSGKKGKVGIPIEYKFNEDNILTELSSYIASTYSQHYMLDGKQTLERSKAKGYALASCITNCMKYLDRYELKGTQDDWRKDLVKNIHYGILALHMHDEKYNIKK